MVDMFTIYATEVSATEQIKDTKSIIDSFNIIVDALQNFWYVIALLITAIIFISSFSCVRKRSIKYTKTQLFALNKSGKYIPGMFVELNETKELLRFFLYGKEWKKRLIKKYNFIYKNFYGDILRKANIDDSISFHIKRREKLDTIESTINHAIEYHEKFSKGQIKLKDRYKESEALFRLLHHPFTDALYELQGFAQASNRNYIVLTGSAGNGKTNLLCSIAELAISLKKPVIFLNSRDIEGNIDEYILNCLNVHQRLQKHPKLYFRVLNFLLLIKKQRFFVIIDAVNENDHEGFADTITTFVNTMESYPNFKILVSCRSEYYIEKYANPLSERITQEHIVCDVKNGVYPKAAINRLFNRYAEHFNYTGYISDAVKHVLSQHLLLLRIFYEVKQNCNEDVLSIRKHELFDAYIQFVKERISSKIEIILDCAVDFMLENMTFDYVEFDSLSAFSENELSVACDETVLINKKLVSHEGTIARSEKEVFAFVYDEIRDYYIARRIMQASAKQDSFDCDSIIRSVQIIRESKASCEEGVIQYTYDFFRTASEIDDEDRIRYCNQILDFYRIEDRHRTQYWHSHHREEFINYGLKIIFSSGLPLTDNEIEYIQDCLIKAPHEDGGKLFDTMLSGTMVGLENNLDKYLNILLGLHEINAIGKALGVMPVHTFDGVVNLPFDLIKCHKKMSDKDSGRSSQIQKIAELYMLMFRPAKDERDYVFREYFIDLPGHENVKEEMQHRLITAIEVRENG